MASVKSDKYVASCKACKKSFRIGGEGISQIESHGKGDGLTANFNKLKDQRILSISNNTLSLASTPSEIKLNNTELITKSEMLQSWN